MLFRQIQCFHAVVDSGSFSEAGERCHISQSAVSQQIKALEDELGTPLFQRQNRSFSLTPAGKLFYRKSTALLSDYEQLVQEVKQMGRKSGNTLRIGYLSCYGGKAFQSAVDSFVRQHPDVALEILNGSQEELYSAIRSGKVHLVLNDQRRLYSEDFVDYELVKSRCYVELNSGHPLAQQDRLDPEQLTHTSCILVAGLSHRRALQAYYREALGFRGEFLFAHSLQEARAMVSNAQGFLPVEDLEESRSRVDRVVRISLYKDGKPVLRNYRAFWRSDHPSGLVEEFASLLKSQFPR